MANPYFIKIELPDDSGSNGAVAGGGTASTGVDNPPEDASINRVLSASKKLVSFAAVASTADKLISYEISQVSLRTGATEYEQRLNTVYSAGKQVVGAGMALGVGFAAGGPAGLAVAAIGLVASGINTAINIAQKQQTLLTERALENISIGMYNVRAGSAGRRSQDQ